MSEATGVRLLLAGALALLLAYLVRVNQLLGSTPDEVRKLAGPPWTPDLLRQTYRELEQQQKQHQPPEYAYTDKLPPRLDRRYIVTGGSGLVGGHIVRQLLARGTPARAIRIVDIRAPEEEEEEVVDFARADVSSRASVDAAFARPWPADVARRPLTVFHTAAVILASERSRRAWALPEAVNVRGTEHVLAAARASGASVFSATSSGSIAIRPVQPFAWALPPPPWKWQWRTRRRSWYFGNYPASKAAAERLVCAADAEGFRAGCVRPANGVYGDPTDNTVGDPLAREVLPTWVPHITQSFVHGANVAIAQFVLPGPGPTSRHGGRPYVVTDPNPPITFGDLYRCIQTLSVHRLVLVRVPPVAVLLLAHAVEAYDELRRALPRPLEVLLPPLGRDIRHLKPGLFSICTHLVAADAEARRPVDRGGLGYEGVVTTLRGMVGEVLEWNREHTADDDDGGGGPSSCGGGEKEKGEAAKAKVKVKARPRRSYTTSVSLADTIRALAMSTTTTTTTGGSMAD
ncbi:hypothetical protein GGR56DRAFT_695172 [Xylariaceae sp. FL0804]|nr:hypothetical protein GGR56DRAFT_695172 [Xylariaceae sp. FL0804]